MPKNKFLLIILFIQTIFTIYIQKILVPIRFAPQNFFFLELIGRTGYLPGVFIILLNAGNLVLLWLIARRLFKGNLSLIAPLVYALSPWANYLAVAGSFYIYLLFLVLLTFNGWLLFEGGQKKLGSVLMVLGAVGSFYSSILLFVLPLALVLVIPRRLARLILLLTLPLLFLIILNKANFRNVIASEVRFLSDPGLLNNVNTFQGGAREEGWGQLARLSENKYLFSLEFLFLKVVKQLTPATYFTSQEKLLHFSFSPPLYWGWSLPFLFGVYLILKSKKFKKDFLIISLLIVPSVFSQKMVDLNRLVLVSPFIILLISYGLIVFWKRHKLLLWVTLFLVILQIGVTLIDLNFREKERYARYFGQDYNLGKQ